MKLFSELIINWYNSHKRDLPWRNTKDAFNIWLSEIILQQTRVNQGLSYYLRFTGRFKNIASLAEASEEEVLKLWQGLGYYSRARNLHAAARQIMNEFDGEFPADHAKLLTIKGIGEYSAAAIASLAFDLPYPVIDGNVYRVMARFAMIEAPVNSTQGKKKVSLMLNELIDQQQPGIFNQAMMELGATVCTPGKPNCGECPLNTDCLAFNQNKTADFPVKAPKKVPSDRFFHYIFILFKVNNIWCTLIRQRPPGDIWPGLYEFPLIETHRQLTENEIITHNKLIEFTQGSAFEIIHFSKPIRHQLTHRNIHARFLTICLNNNTLSFDNNLFTIVHLNNLFKYPVSRLIDGYLSNSLIINIMNKLLKKD